MNRIARCSDVTHQLVTSDQSFAEVDTSHVQYSISTLSENQAFPLPFRSSALVSATLYACVRATPYHNVRDRDIYREHPTLLHLN